MSDAGGNFISDKFRQFCKRMNIEQASSSSYHHQSNGQVEACIKFIKHTMKKCIETNEDKHVALLQIRSASLEPGLLSPATLLFNCIIPGIMPIINRLPINLGNDEEHYEVLYSFSIDLNITYLTKHIHSDILEYMIFQNNHIFSYFLKYVCNELK